MCKLVTVGVLPLWLSFSAQCNLSLSEWGILLLSFMIIVLIYLHNILMLQDVAAPVVVCVIFLCGCCWVIMGPECLVQWRFSTRQISQQTLKPQLLDPPGLYTILPHFRYFSFPSVYFCFVYIPWGGTPLSRLPQPSPCLYCHQLSVEPSLSQNWVELHLQSAAK